MPDLNYLASGIVIALAVGAGAMDYRTRRIPNWLTVWGALAGVVLSGLAGDGALLRSLGGMGVALAVGVLLYGLKALGAGDAKFMAAVGAWAGWTRLPGAFLAMLGGGALFALIWSARHRLFRATLLSTSTMVGTALSGGGKGIPWVGNTAPGRFPYGVGLGLGAIVWWFLAGGRLP